MPPKPDNFTGRVSHGVFRMEIKELPKNRDQQPITLIFSRHGRRISQELHCLACGLTFYETTMVLNSAVDNGGLTDMDYSDIMCKRCKQVYRIVVI